MAISILSGLHAGAEMQLATAHCRIGADTDCDVALLDEGVQARHLRVSAAGRAVIIEALDGDAVVNHTTRLPAGRGMRSALPADIRIGQVRMRLQADGPRAHEPLGAPRSPRAPTRVWRITAGAAVLGILGLVQAPGLEEAGAAARMNDATQMNDAMQMHHATRKGDATLPAAPRASIVDAAAALQRRLDAAGLGALDVAREHGLLRVSGTIGARAQPALRDIQQWFDATYGDTHVLHSTVTTAAAATSPQLKIRAVWQGAQPYIIDGQGERRYPGAVFEGGWKLAGIESSRVVFQRGGEEFSLTL